MISIGTTRLHCRTVDIRLRHEELRVFFLHCELFWLWPGDPSTSQL